MTNTGLEEAQAGMKIARRNINNLRYADDTTFMAESEEELKSLLMKVKEFYLKYPKTEKLGQDTLCKWYRGHFQYENYKHYIVNIFISVYIC